MRTRFWSNPDGCSSTCVQVRDDAQPMVHLHTNMGWVPIGNAPKTYHEAEKFAEEIAKGYGLEEADEEQAIYMAGG